MTRREYLIIDEAGLHARPASLLVRVATSFQDEVFIEFKDKRLTLKSIMAVMSLGVPKDSTIVIEVVGDNEEKAFEEIEKVLTEHGLI